MKTMTLEALQAEVAKVQYRPGWHFKIWRHQFEGNWLTITADLLNAYSPGEIVTVKINTAIPNIPSEEYFHNWLAYRIGRIELHELREWYRVDGVRVFDPHAENANDESKAVDE